MSSLDNMIAVLQDLKAGFPIEVSSNYGSTWSDMMEGEGFNFVACRYRRKPEPPTPREWYLLPAMMPIQAIPAGGILPYGFTHHDCIHVREVLE